MKSTLGILAVASSALLCGCGRDLPSSPVITEEPLAQVELETFLVTPTFAAQALAEVPERSAIAPDDEQVVGAADPAIFWNRLTTELGLQAALPPPLFARAYALAQIGIYDALAVASRRRRFFVDEAVAAGVADEVLSYLFPSQADRIHAQALAQAGLGTGGRRASWLLGRAVGRIVVIHGRNDGSDVPFTGTIPTGDGIWTGTNPVLPNCGSWTCWIIEAGQQFQPEPPYPFGSAKDLSDVAEVLEVSLHRTPEQIAIVHKWADRPPPVIWNGLLLERLEARGWNRVRSARALAFLNVALYDAFVSCWRTKYTYWTARPFQRTPGLVTVIATPNFPSYTSGHSTISAASAEVMGELFPEEAVFFHAQADEAAMSRLWGGIHFRHDNDQGLVVGRKIGQVIVNRMRGRHSGTEVAMSR